MRSRSMALALAFLGASAIAGGAAAAGCGGDGAGSQFDGGQDGNAGDDDGGGGIGDSGFVDAKACTGLACNQVACTGSAKTTLSGIVYDPAGKVPLYNVVVYVPHDPTAALPAITTGASCDTCDAQVKNALVSALTDAAGHFTLENVPVDVDFPLIVQVGKWRRVINVPKVTQCVDTQVPDKTVRLPRNRGEGSIPRIALTTGGADPLECLLRKIGLDDAEFNTAGSDASVHLYRGGDGPDGNAATKFASTLNNGADFALATDLWSSTDKLKAYDIALLACEGQPNSGSKPQAALDALYAFESQGGRVFASHWHDFWFDAPGVPPFGSVSQTADTKLRTAATWTDITPPPYSPPTAKNISVSADVNLGFPKGQALHDWLKNVGALSADKLPILEAKHNVSAVDVDGGVQSWLSLQNPYADGGTAIEYLTFNTPRGVPTANQCGRVVYSDLHVSSGDAVGQAFPTGCTTQDLSPQEKALEFMLFDLSSCIQDDNKPPQPPK